MNTSESGLKKLIPVSDLHMHISSEKIGKFMQDNIPAEALMGLDLSEHNAQDCLDLLDAAGIQKAFVLSNAYGWGSDMLPVGDDELDLVRWENEFTAQEAAKATDRLTTFYSINPLKDYALEEMERCYQDLKMSGLKMHFTNSGVDIRDTDHRKKVKTVLEKAAQLGSPALIHFRSRLPDFGKQDADIFVREVFNGIPNLRVQMAHVGSWGGYDDNTVKIFNAFIDALEENPILERDNFYFDISAVVLDKPMSIMQPPTDEQLKQLAGQLRRYGLDHILFGSDWFAFKPGEYKDLLLERLPLTPEEFETMFKNDGQVLFG